MEVEYSDDSDESSEYESSSEDEEEEEDEKEKAPLLRETEIETEAAVATVEASGHEAEEVPELLSASITDEVPPETEPVVKSAPSPVGVPGEVTALKYKRESDSCFFVNVPCSDLMSEKVRHKLKSWCDEVGVVGGGGGMPMPLQYKISTF